MAEWEETDRLDAEERAGICEYLGGLAREEAEQLAAQLVASERAQRADDALRALRGQAPRRRWQDP